MSNPHFNGLNPAEAERLAILAEECAEVIQVVGKILRHGYESRHPDGGPSNRERLHIEIADILYSTALMKAKGDIEMEDFGSLIQQKAEKISKYLHHQ